MEEGGGKGRGRWKEMDKRGGGKLGRGGGDNRMREEGEMPVEEMGKIEGSFQCLVT